MILTSQVSFSFAKNLELKAKTRPPHTEYESWGEIGVSIYLSICELRRVFRTKSTVLMTTICNQLAINEQDAKVLEILIL